MRTGFAIVGLALMALGWMNATWSDRHPALLVLGCVLVLTSMRWSSRDLGIAAGVLAVPLVYWLWDATTDQGTICREGAGCTTPWSPPDAVETAIELVPYLLIAWLAWRLWQHNPLASRPVVPAREGGL